MERENMRGKAQTVRGLIDSDKLGFTLPHEHLFVDLRCYWVEPTNSEGKNILTRYHNFLIS